MLSSQYTYKCSGCGKEKKCIFPKEKFKIILMDYTKEKPGETFLFCGIGCLRKWLNRGELK